VTPILKGTAARLGLRKPQPRRWAMGVSVADIEAAHAAFVKAMRDTAIWPVLPPGSWWIRTP
jgi:hypothetical protein